MGLHAQKITFGDGEVSVGRAVEAIRQQAGYSVSYNKNLLDPERSIPVTKDGMGLTTLLNTLVADVNAQYVVKDDAVTFIPVIPAPEPAPKPAPAEPVEIVLQPVEVVASPPSEEPVVTVVQKEAVTTPVNVSQVATSVSDAPRWALKTNLLSDLTTTLNLGAEVRVAKRVTIELPVSYNIWEFKNYRKWKHVAVQPAVRLWLGEAYSGHFFGAHLHYAYYNIGNLPEPFTSYMRTHRFEGWLAGAGASWGYRWNFSPRWALEAEVGVGYARLEYDKFECITCNDFVGRETKNYFGPTKAAVNLVMAFGRPATKAESTVSKSSLTFDVEVKVGITVTPTVAPSVPSPVALEETTPAVEPAPKPDTVANIRLEPSFVVPETKLENARTEAGKAFLDFPAGSDRVNQYFRNNAAELEKIHEMARGIASVRNSKITAVTLTGFASPDGSAQSNLSLSQRRAISLKSLLQSSTMIPAEVFSATGRGEDWDGLYKLVENSAVPHRLQVMDIIDNTASPEQRKARLAALYGGEPWRWMKSQLFPQLRRVDYNIEYTVAPFTIEDGRRTMVARPQSLSLDEMFKVAASYPLDSQEYYDAMITAARIYPEDDVANINAAAAALTCLDADTAARYLDLATTHRPEWWDNMGIVYYLRGDVQRALVSFENAEKEGLEKAKKHREYLTNDKNTNQTQTIKPLKL